MTEKHFLFATGLHNITGSRAVIEILNKLGHSTDYQTCEIETTHARKKELSADKTSILTLKPRDQKSIVPISGWTILMLTSKK